MEHVMKLHRCHNTILNSLLMGQRIPHQLPVLDNSYTLRDLPLYEIAFILLSSGH